MCGHQRGKEEEAGADNSTKLSLGFPYFHPGIHIMQEDRGSGVRIDRCHKNRGGWSMPDIEPLIEIIFEWAAQDSMYIMTLHF